ncbi:MAG TPA: MBL fold metallo-hydrolase [Acidimicrobiales bacterium]|nr:MBL fold metallo-hydrolase [Acidimicrobiales bacterium]
MTDGVGKVTPAQLFAPELAPAGGKGRAAADWVDHAQFLDGDGRLEMPIGALVVVAAERVVLVDGGYGPAVPATVENGASLLRNLAAAGFTPDDVTDVVFSHLHADHIGWASVDGVATFPRATYRCDARDWAHFVDGAADDQASDAAYRRNAYDKLTPIAARFETWSSDGPLFGGVDVVHAPGHTPGNNMIVLSAGSERAVFLGDVVHCPVQLLDDEWARIADVDEAIARRTQARIARELEAAGTPVVGAHFPGLRFGRVLFGDAGRQWVIVDR